MAKKTGLVFTGGGLRGVCAQLGALEALAEQDLRFDVVIGTSAGAIVGALYACGLEPPDIRKRLLDLRAEDFLDPLGSIGLVGAALGKLQGLTGYYQGRALLSWLRRNLPVERLERTPRKLYIPVVNVSRGIPEVKSEGPLAEIVRASMAVPFVFALQEIDGEYYADGGAANNVPARALIEQEPELERLLVLTSLQVRPDVPPPDNDFLGQDFTPARVLGRVLEAVSDELRLDDIAIGARALTVLRVRTSHIGLDEVDQIGTCIDEAVANVRTQIASNAIDLSSFGPA